MKKLFSWVIQNYGQEAVCRTEDGEELGREMVIVRPMTEKDWQQTAGALGSGRADRFLGLAVPELPVADLGVGGWLEWADQKFEVMTCQPVYVGETVTHLWLALRPCGEVAP